MRLYSEKTSMITVLSSSNVMTIIHRMYPVKALQCRHLPLKGIQILCCGITDLHAGIDARNVKIHLDIFRGNIIFIFTV